MNKNNKDRMSDKSPQELLMEIRNLLTKRPEETNRHLHHEDKNIDQLLTESIAKSKQMKKQPVKAETQFKLQQVSHLLQNQQNFIQSYAKQKINSQIFSNLRKNISEKEANYFQKQREQLLKQRQLEEQQQRQRQNRVIQSTKKFVKYQSKTLPYEQINYFTMKEGEGSLPYLLNQAAQSSKLSNNNNIPRQLTDDLEQKYQEQKESQIKSNKSHQFLEKPEELNQQDLVFQIKDDDEKMNQNYLKQQSNLQLMKILKKCPKFVQTFKHILINQIKLQKHLDQQTSSSKNRSSAKKSEFSYHYTNQPVEFNKYQKSKDSLVSSVAVLTKKYRSKGIVLKEMGMRSILQQNKVICQKIVSKMNGDSSNFHPKKIILTQNELAWCEQGEQISVQSKRVILTVQDISVIRCKKEQGGFFSKSQSQIQVVLIKGQNRSLKFQKNYLQGDSVYSQLCNLMAIKMYNLNVILSCKVNEQLLTFINDPKATIFNLSQQFLQSHEKYPNVDYRIMIINIIVALFQNRKDVQTVNLSSCKLNTLQINTICKKLHQFNRINTITISQTKFNVQTMLSLTKLISNLNSQNLSVTLSNCYIDDNLLIKSKQNLIKCTNIRNFNISLNTFTMEGFTVINELCSQPHCEMKELNINSCHIINLVALGELIKKGKKLQILFAEDCGFSFQSNQEMSTFFQCCRNSKLKRLSLLRNDVVNNLKLFEDFWVNDTPKQINVDLGIFNEKTSKNLQGKLI